MNNENLRMRPVRILLIEDNPADTRLTVESFKDCRISNIVDTVIDGEEAMDFLLKKGKYEKAETPDLILLDLNLPRKDGREVLAEIKNDKVLKRIPAVVLTSSSAEKDILQSYDLHANAYLIKPVDLAQFTDVISSIEDFWLSIVKLPKI